MSVRAKGKGKSSTSINIDLDGATGRGKDKSKGRRRRKRPEGQGGERRSRRRDGDDAERGGRGSLEDEYVPVRDNANQVMFYPREFANVNDGRSSSYFDFKRYEIEWKSGEDYRVGKKVGEGHFGEVIQAWREDSDKNLVIKTLKVSNRELVKLQQEVKMLEYIRGAENCVQMLGCVHVPELDKKGLVFELVESVDPKRLYPKLNDLDRRFFALEILRALYATHSRGIIHRDVKPSNVLIDPKRRTVRLCDWGVAGFYRRDVRNAKGPGTRCYKAPELSLGYEYYDYAVDMWAFGLLFGSMMLLRRPLIPSKGGWTKQLEAVVQVVGSDDLLGFAKKLNIVMDDQTVSSLSGFEKVDFKDWVDVSNADKVTPDGLDLLSKLVVCDHQERLTASEAIAHPYFDSVRNLAKEDPLSPSASWFTSSSTGSAITSTED